MRKIVQRAKVLFIKSFIRALVGACFFVALDMVFSVIAPRGYISMRGDMLMMKANIFMVDGILVYFFILVVNLIGSLVGRYCSRGILFIATVFYLMSWSTFVVVGEFLGVEGIHFFISNFKDIIWMMNQISKWYVVALAGVMLLPLVVYLMLNRIKKKRRNGGIAPTGNGNSLFIRAAFCTAIFGVILLVLPKNLSSKNMFDLQCRVSPLSTLYFDQQKEDIPEEYDISRNYLNMSLNKIISWPEYQQMQYQEPRSIPVIVIVIESLRSDVLDHSAIMPNLYALKQEGILLKPYSSSSQTDYAWPSLLSSQYPMRSGNHFYYPQSIRFPRVTIYDLLKHAGFSTAIFSAQNERWGGMFNFLNTGGLDIFFDAGSSNQGKYVSQVDRSFANFVKKFGLSGKLDDAVIVEEAMQWVKQLQSPKFFLALNFQRSHYPYTWPDSFQVPFHSCPPQIWNYPLEMSSQVRDRYFNALRYTDAQIGKFIRFLKDQGRYDQSIIFVLGDHGEAFHEHGKTQHGNQLFDETVKTLMVVKGFNQALALASKKAPELMDMGPTICEMLGLTVHPGFQGLSWLNPKPTAKPVFITINNPAAKMDAIIEDHWKLIKDYKTGRVMLFNLKQDPEERLDVFNRNSNRGRHLLFKLLFWRFKQIEYYSKSSLSERFYPPQFLSH